MERRTRRIAAAGAAAAIGLGAAGATHGATAGGGGDPAADLAEALNEREGTSLTAEDVRAAMRDVLRERLDEAVRDGRLTREQADEMLERAGERGPFPGGLPHLRHRGAPPGIVAAAAEAIGIGERALHERLRDGDSMAEVARGRGVAAAKVVAAVAAELREGERGDRLTATRATEIATRIVNAEPGEHGPAPGWGPPPRIP